MGRALRLASEPINDVRSKKLIALAGWGIAASWITFTALAAIAGRGLSADQQPASQNYALGFHPYSQSPILFQLLSYSFIHPIWAALVRWGVIQMAGKCLTPSALVRLYSLGTISCGLVYLLIRWRIHESAPLTGAGVALFALLAALAVLNPRQGVLLFFSKETTLPWAVVWIGLIQFLFVKIQPGLSLGLLAERMAGTIYGIIEEPMGSAR